MRNQKHSSIPNSSSAKTSLGQADTPETLTPLLTRILDDLRVIRSMLAGTRKDFYTVEEVAQLTGRTSYTVRRWVTANRIAATRVEGTGPRGRLLIARDQLDRLIGAGMGTEIPPGIAE
jgi:excisionase family DNA binding protein